MIVTWLLVIGFALEIGCRAYLLGDDADVVIRSPTPPWSKRWDKIGRFRNEKSYIVLSNTLQL